MMKKNLLKTLVAVVAASAVLFAACGGGNGEGGGTDSIPVVADVTEGEWVDLGLPSGLLWATCNLGATSPEEYGDYYAWGETTPKSVYDWSTYRYANDSSTILTKYCNDSVYGYNGFTDNFTTLLSEDDAATQVLGNSARIPSKDEWQELIDNTTAEWATMNGVYGRKFTATNGNTLFLPAAGFRYGGTLGYADSISLYWSASLGKDDPSRAWNFYFHSGNQYVSSGGRNYGQSVRAVRASEN